MRLLKATPACIPFCVIKGELMKEVSAGSKNICIKIDFERDSINPQRVFESMSHLISSIENFHSCLLSSVSAETKSRFLLTDVKEGSIESWLSPTLEGEIDESKTSRLAQFLNNCTDKIIAFIDGKDTLQTIKEVNELEVAIAAEASKLDVEEFPNVFSLDKHRLLKGFTELGQATAQLNGVDVAYFGSVKKVRKINKDFRLSEDDLKTLIIERIDKHHSKEVLTIKKADFIASSMWDFIRRKVTIPVKLRDENWLNRFHQRLAVVSPGDGLLCDLVTFVYYDKNDREIDVKYEVIKVHDKVESGFDQLELDHE